MVLKNLEIISLKNYGLCPSNYLSAPSLSWDAMLKMNEIEIELTPDPDMYIFFEKGTRGGISYIFNSYRGGHRKSTFVEEGRRASLK